MGVSRELISRIENDRLDNVPAGKLQSCVQELGGYLRVEVLWQGERLPRLLDARHTLLQNRFVIVLERDGWDVRVEVSFNHFGDRGRIDVLAYHVGTRVLAVVEIKPTVGDAQDTLGRLDVKVRLAQKIAADLGWRASSVVPVLVLEDGTTPRRHVSEHAGLFRKFERRGRSALAWLWVPVGPPPAGILLFLPASPDSHPRRPR
jgi:hypothetical protein